MKNILIVISFLFCISKVYALENLKSYKIDLTSFPVNILVSENVDAPKYFLVVTNSCSILNEGIESTEIMCSFKT